MATPPDETLPPLGSQRDETLVGLLDRAPGVEPGWGGDGTSPDPVAPGQDPTAVAAPLPDPAALRGERYVATPDGEIGRGGMGRVEVMRDRVLGRPVARKVLEPVDGAPTPTLVTRFLREARVTARLEHPGIVPVHDLVRLDDGRLAYTMKRVRGQTLGGALAGAVGLPARMRLLGHLEDVCNALAFAHAQGVVHRDLKPDNVLIGAFGETVVIDWGLARVEGEAEPPPDIPPTEPDRSPAPGLTRVGHVIGTPRYMSPEQARADHARVDARTDVWALGLMLRELLTGARPHGDGDAEALLMQARQGHLAPTAGLAPGAPRPLCAIADKATAHDPADRYRDAAEMAADVAAWRAGAPVAAHRYGLADQIVRLVAHNRRAAGVAALAGLTLLGLSAAYAVRLGAARDEARHEQALAVKAEQSAQVGMLRAKARRAETLGHHDRGLALLWAAHEADRGQRGDLTAELARAVAQAWPQQLVHAAEQPVRGLFPAPGGLGVFAVLRDGGVWTGGAGGLEPTGARAAPDEGVLASDGRGLLGAVASGAGVVAWRRDATGAPTARWSVAGPREAYVLAAAPDGGAVVGGAGGALLLLAGDGSVTTVGADPRLAQVDAVAVSARRGRVFSASMLDDAIRVWAWPDGSASEPIPLGGTAVQLAVAEPADRLLSLTDDGLLHAHTLGGVPAWTLAVGGGGGRLVVAPDGRHAVVLTRRGELVHVALDAGRELWRRAGLGRTEHAPPVFDRAGAQVAVPGPSNGVVVLGTRAGDVQARLGGGSRPLSGLLFTDDGALWGASEDGTVRRWTAPGGRAGWTWRGGEAVITAAAADPDAGALLVGDAGGAITLIDAGTGRGTRLAALGRPVCAVAPLTAGWVAVVAESCGGRPVGPAPGAGWQVFRAGAGGPPEARAGGETAGSVVVGFDREDPLVLHDGCVERAGGARAGRIGCLGEAPGWHARALMGTPDGGVVVAGGGGGAGLVGLGPDGETRFTARPRIAVASPGGAHWAVTTPAGLGLLDARTGAVVSLMDLDSPAQSLAWSGDGGHLAWSEEALGVGVLPIAGGPPRRLGAEAGAIDQIALSAGAAWVAGQDEQGTLYAWTAGLAEPVVAHPGEPAAAPLAPVFVGGTVVRFQGAAASAPPLPSGVSAAALAAAAAERTPWRACAGDGSLALLPEQPRARSLAACLRGR